MTSKNPPLRENELCLAARISEDINASKVGQFILTGSYSIDLLTEADVKHNDIDANIFTTNIQTSLGEIGLLLQEQHDLIPVVATNTRLEYDYSHDDEGAGVSRVELQFVEYVDRMDSDEGVDFTLPSTEARGDIIVPTVWRQANITTGVDELPRFLVKSLPFAIATWALRISGLATDQKRAVRQTDIDHFVFLLDVPHVVADIERAILHHPQMPPDGDPLEVLSLSQTIALEEGQR